MEKTNKFEHTMAAVLQVIRELVLYIAGLTLCFFILTNLPHIKDRVLVFIEQQQQRTQTAGDYLSSIFNNGYLQEMFIFHVYICALAFVLASVISFYYKSHVFFSKMALKTLSFCVIFPVITVLSAAYFGLSIPGDIRPDHILARITTGSELFSAAHFNFVGLVAASTYFVFYLFNGFINTVFREKSASHLGGAARRYPQSHRTAFLSSVTTGFWTALSIMPAVAVSFFLYDEYTLIREPITSSRLFLKLIAASALSAPGLSLYYVYNFFMLFFTAVWVTFGSLCALVTFMGTLNDTSLRKEWGLFVFIGCIRKTLCYLPYVFFKSFSKAFFLSLGLAGYFLTVFIVKNILNALKHRAPVFSANGTASGSASKALSIASPQKSALNEVLMIFQNMYAIIGIFYSLLFVIPMFFKNVIP